MSFGEYSHIGVNAELLLGELRSCPLPAPRVRPQLPSERPTEAERCDVRSPCFLRAIEFGAGDSARLGLARMFAQTDRAAAALMQLDLCEDQANQDVLELRTEIKEG